MGILGKSSVFQFQLTFVAQVHDTAFSDSPAERQIYEIGIQVCYLAIDDWNISSLI